MTEVSKKVNLQSHTAGSDCNCKKLKCFQNDPENRRKKIFKDLI